MGYPYQGPLLGVSNYSSVHEPPQPGHPGLVPPFGDCATYSQSTIGDPLEGPSF